MDSAWGTVNYLAAGSTRNRLYVAPGDQRATARYEAHRVRSSDGRLHRGDLTLDAAGFTLVDHQTSVPGLDDVVPRRRRGRAAPRVGRTAHRRLLPLSWLTC